MDIQKYTTSEDNDTMSRKFVLEIALILAASILVYILAGAFDILERLAEFAWKHENLEIDELISVSVFLSFAFLVFWIRRWKSLKQAVSEIRQLRGIIPICASCKRVRDDDGYWHQVEAYISEHSDALFSHGICPDCMRKFYPEYAE